MRPIRDKKNFADITSGSGDIEVERFDFGATWRPNRKSQVRLVDGFG